MYQGASNCHISHKLKTKIGEYNVKDLVLSQSTAIKSGMFGQTCSRKRNMS